MTFSYIHIEIIEGRDNSYLIIYNYNFSLDNVVFLLLPICMHIAGKMVMIITISRP